MFFSGFFSWIFFHDPTRPELVGNKNNWNWFQPAMRGAVCKPEFRFKNPPEAVDMSHGQKTRGPLLSIESWMVNRDPYFMVYEIFPI